MLCPQRPPIGHPFKLPDEDTWLTDHTCSYCGSLSPDEFFRLVEAGAEVGPTDKGYKAYLNHQTLPFQAKFYFQHLSLEDRERFIQLYNSKEMKLGYPGYFYRLPYFAEQLPEV